MNIVFIEIVQIVILASVLGFVTAQTAKFLDFSMDYGHILSWIRERKASVYARKTNLLPLYTKKKEEALRVADFGDRLDSMDKLYWTIARNESGFVLWLCKYCLSHRILAFINAVLFGFTVIIPEWEFVYYIIFVFVSISVNQKVISYE